MESCVGPFFYIKGIIIADTTPVGTAEKYGGKMTSAVSHSDLFDRTIKHGEYMVIPRGRVVWDTIKNESIIYLDKCLDEKSILDEISRVFDLADLRVEYDEHYICPKCKPRTFNHLM